jgi:(5-formylfuran-3-yl)methyl phosphate synthase
MAADAPVQAASSTQGDRRGGAGEMTLFLASVANAAEAEIVLQFGADIIDLKDPAHGALGAVDLEHAGAAIRMIARRRRTSATLGDPPYTREGLVARTRALVEAGIDDLKLAVDAQTLELLADELKSLAGDVALIGMMFADRALAFDLLPRLAALGFKGAMLDTADKRGGRLLTHLDVARLDEFCAQCRALGLVSGLAGSLEAPDVPRLLLVAPDVLGFRGALCRAHDRGGVIDPAAVNLIRDLIPRVGPAAAGSQKIDWRLLARGFMAGQEREHETDNVFVRDFVIAAQIGAYDYERGASQRVVFNVEAAVGRAGAHADDMRAIFSYDLILDAIRLVVGRGHAEFVETLAEGVAEIVLRHPRVKLVRVRVEKLDVIDGAVGVEIRRERAPGASDTRLTATLGKSKSHPKD